jgi:N-acetylmuramoyl-L-alanine amidase
LLVLAACLGACAPAPVRTGLPSEWSPSPNFNARRPAFIIIHHTGSASLAGALSTLKDPRREVSAHYVIAQDGRIFQLVDERDRAWHAGVGRWGADQDVNSASIGIELVNSGSEPFAPEQIVALIALAKDIQQRYRIPAENILGHGDIAPRRKVDPSAFFPWDLLAAQGLGLWCAAPPAEPAPESDALLGLQAIGYDTTDPAAALGAFRLHFNRADLERTDGFQPTPLDRRLIACLAAARAGWGL